MSGFRKFGTSDAPITTDQDDRQGISKQAVAEPAPWTPADDQDLQQELTTEKNANNQSGGSVDQ